VNGDKPDVQVPSFAPRAAGDRIRDLLDQERDVAAGIYTWLTPDQAVAEFRKDGEDRRQREAEREAAKIEQARLAAEQAAQAKWREENPSFAELADFYLRATVDREPVAPYPGQAPSQRPLARTLGFLILELRRLESRLAELESQQR
jgi:hypothetical protein